MADKAADCVEAAAEKTAQPVQRLCNEIQLFDLCELEKCGHKKGPYCTSTELLNRFEAIAEEDERPAASAYGGEEDDDERDDSSDDSYCDDEGYQEDHEEE